jgi:hypothetical protein
MKLNTAHGFMDSLYFGLSIDNSLANLIFGDLYVSDAVRTRAHRHERLFAFGCGTARIACSMGTSNGFAGAPTAGRDSRPGPSWMSSETIAVVLARDWWVRQPGLPG